MPLHRTLVPAPLPLTSTNAPPPDQQPAVGFLPGTHGRGRRSAAWVYKAEAHLGCWSCERAGWLGTGVATTTTGSGPWVLVYHEAAFRVDHRQRGQSRRPTSRPPGPPPSFPLPAHSPRVPCCVRRVALSRPSCVSLFVLSLCVVFGPLWSLRSHDATAPAVAAGGRSSDGSAWSWIWLKAYLNKNHAFPRKSGPFSPYSRTPFT